MDLVVRSDFYEDVRQINILLGIEIEDEVLVADDLFVDQKPLPRIDSAKLTWS